MHFNIFLGQQVQTVEIDCVKAFNFGPAATDDEVQKALIPPPLAK